MSTPKGTGVKSINVTARKMWSAYANKRRFRTLPGVETVFSRAGRHVDLTLVRENIEDTYGGVEHMLTQDVALCRRFITRPGSERVHRYAFELARSNGKTTVTCGHKANIMKLTDGLFVDTFYDVARDYPEIEARDLIVDDMAMKLVTTPEAFQVVVLPNLQGDILSDLCAGLVGGLGFAPAANVGDHVSIFEAVHGSAPDIAGSGVANPIALLLSATMLLRHLGLAAYATSIESALERALAAGARTRDFGDRARPALSTRELAARIAAEVERPPPVSVPDAAPVRAHRPAEPRMLASELRAPQEIAGADFFVETTSRPALLAERIAQVVPPEYRLTMISNRGTQVWPRGSALTDCVDQYRIRVESAGPAPARVGELLELAASIHAIARLCSVEMLLTIAGKPAYSLAQGQG
ncbi:MAG TPA: isocitrate/isopropylmalate family dehydrogenase, partial [Labilithrix sp.]|nr:isocitrate/isopropylmalate family dehydrogenase [Labilithrix sp.]